MIHQRCVLTMSANPKISVLIPAFNEEHFIATTIDSVHRSFEAIQKIPYEIVVCDNHSTDATSNIAQSKGARVIFEPHNQIARARNIAAKAAQGQWFIFLDADTPLNSNVLHETVKFIESGKVGAGGAIMAMDSDKLSPSMNFLLRTWNHVSVRFKLAAGAYLFCHRDAWEETRGFDESLYVSEEINFSLKLKAWCQSKDMRFHVITTAPIITSSRKLHWYTPWRIFRQFLVLTMPFAAKRRQKCSLWYERPKLENQSYTQ